LVPGETGNCKTTGTEQESPQGIHTGFCVNTPSDPYAHPQTDSDRALRAESKGAKILELIGRPKGASLAEIIAYASHSNKGAFLTN